MGQKKYYLYLLGWWNDDGVRTRALAHTRHFSAEEFRELADGAMKTVACRMAANENGGPVGAGDLVTEAVLVLVHEHGFTPIGVAAAEHYLGSFPLTLTDARGRLVEVMGAEVFAELVNHNRFGTSD